MPLWRRLTHSLPPPTHCSRHQRSLARSGSPLKHQHAGLDATSQQALLSPGSAVSVESLGDSDDSEASPSKTRDPSRAQAAAPSRLEAERSALEETVHAVLSASERAAGDAGVALGHVAPTPPSQPRGRSRAGSVSRRSLSSPAAAAAGGGRPLSSAMHATLDADSPRNVLLQQQVQDAQAASGVLEQPRPRFELPHATARGTARYSMGGVLRGRSMHTLTAWGCWGASMLVYSVCWICAGWQPMTLRYVAPRDVTRQLRRFLRRQARPSSTRSQASSRFDDDCAPQVGAGRL